MNYEQEKMRQVFMHVERIMQIIEQETETDEDAYDRIYKEWEGIHSAEYSLTGGKLC